MKIHTSEEGNDLISGNLREGVRQGNQWFYNLIDSTAEHFDRPFGDFCPEFLSEDR